MRKRVLEAAKLTYANKIKEYIASQKLGSCDFWRIANSVLSKGKSAIPPLFNSTEVLSSASNKAKLFAENFPKNYTGFPAPFQIEIQGFKGYFRQIQVNFQGHWKYFQGHISWIWIFSNAMYQENNVQSYFESLTLGIQESMLFGL